MNTAAYRTIRDHLDIETHVMKDPTGRTRMTYNGEAWGTAMGAFFGVARVVTYLGYYPPASWRYRPGVGVDERPTDDEDWEAATLLALYEQGAVEVEDIIAFGNVLERYTSTLARAGLAY